jgi:uncharacterized protein YbbK (DUF523 family)
MKKSIAVSACLLGIACRYDGGSNPDQEVIAFVKGRPVIPVCPEILGGMTTPRRPAEIQPDGRVLDNERNDVSACFQHGKEETLALLRKQGCIRIILKDGSPSCGFTRIHDGTFSHRQIPGHGITAQYLADNGITIVDIHKIGQR